jgi:hypothetical protein
VRITTRHAASSYGIPVILDGRGRPMDYATGLKAVFEHLGWDYPTAAGRLDVSVRTVRGWLYEGRTPEVRCLNALRDALEDAQ